MPITPNFTFDSNAFASSFDDSTVISDLFSDYLPPMDVANDPRLTGGGSGTPTTFGSITTQDYGNATQYGSPEEALTNYHDMFTSVSEQQEQTASVYNYNNYDPGDFARAGFSGVKDPQLVAGGAKIADYITNNNIPHTKEIDGKTYYLTTGSGDANNSVFGVLPDSDFVPLGPVGTYSTLAVDKPSILDNPVLLIAASLINPIYGPAALTAAKGLSGETLHASDWATLGAAGYDFAVNGTMNFKVNQYGAPTPTGNPSTASSWVEGVDNIPADQAVGDGWDLISDIRSGIRGVQDSQQITQEEEAADLAESQAAIDAEQAQIDANSTTITDETGADVNPTGETPEPVPTGVDEIVVPDFPVEPIVAPDIIIPDQGGGGSSPPITNNNETPEGDPDAIFEDEPMDKDAWDASVYGVDDTWIGGTFSDIDKDGDGFITSQEMYEWEHDTPVSEEENILNGTVVPNPISDPTPTPNPTEGTVEGGSEDGEGEGEGAGSGVGVGSGDGEGNGEGSGSGSESAASKPIASSTRTTDSLFKDMLTLKTQVGSTQGMLSFAPTQAPTLATQAPAQTNILSNVLNARKQQAAQDNRQGMLTNALPKRRLPY